MPKTYTAAGTVSAGDVYTASAHNIIATDVNNFIVPPTASIYRTSNLTSYTSDADITYETEDWDSDGMVNLGTSATRITIGTDGLYLIVFKVRAIGTASITRTLIKIMLNGTTEIAAFDPAQDPAATGSRAVIFSFVYPLIATNFLTTRVAFTGGSAYIIAGATDENANRTRLSATWIGQKS